MRGRLSVIARGYETGYSETAAALAEALWKKVTAGQPNARSWARLDPSTRVYYLEMARLAEEFLMERAS